jgi:uncharacterized protein YaiL (DUF2058 family)
MGNSLQDQLFKAGLANKKQAVRAKKAKNSKEKLQRTGKEVVDETAELVAKADAEKLAKDRELNRQRTEAANKKSIQAQIKQLVSLNRIDESGEVEYRFNDTGTIRTLMLQNEHRELIIGGRLSIVKVNDVYDIVPRAVATKIAERDESAIIVANDQSAEDEADDEYADYKVPDDLMW